MRHAQAYLTDTLLIFCGYAIGVESPWYVWIGLALIAGLIAPRTKGKTL